MSNYYSSQQYGLPEGPVYPPDPFSSSQQQGSLYRYKEPYRDYPSLNESKPKSSFDHHEDAGQEWAGAGVKAYRKGSQRKNLWTRGGGLFCFGRFFFCTLLIIIYIVVAIILGFALWLRPPSLSFTDPALNSTQGVTIPDSTLTVPLEMNITVNNPDFFSVDVKSLTAEISYPSVNNTVIAQGNLTNLIIQSDQQTNFSFPIIIYLDLSSSSNENSAVVLDLANKCGIIPPGPSEPIPLDIKIGVGLSVLGIRINTPSISFSISIGCPIDDSAIESKLQSILGGALGSL